MKAKRKNIFPAFVGYWFSSSIPLYDLVIRGVIHKFLLSMKLYHRIVDFVTPDTGIHALRKFIYIKRRRIEACMPVNKLISLSGCIDFQWPVP